MEVYRLIRFKEVMTTIIFTDTLFIPIIIGLIANFTISNLISAQLKTLKLSDQLRF